MRALKICTRLWRNASESSNSHESSTSGKLDILSKLPSLSALYQSASFSTLSAPSMLEIIAVLEKRKEC